MPRMDGTGPMGAGAMTGRGMGACSTGTAVSTAGYGMGRGFRNGTGRGSGRGLGRRCCYPAGYSNAAYADDTEILNRQAAILESQLEDVKKRISALNADK